MIYRSNLTLEEILEVLDIISHESKTQFWPILEGTFETKDNNEALPHFLTVQADIKTTKTDIKKYGRKDEIIFR